MPKFFCKNVLENVLANENTLCTIQVVYMSAHK